MVSGLQEGMQADGISMFTSCGQYPAPWVTVKICLKVIELLEHLDPRRDPKWLYLPGQVKPPKPEVAPINSKDKGAMKIE